MTDQYKKMREITDKYSKLVNFKT